MKCKRIFIFFLLILCSCNINEHKNLKKKNIRVDEIKRRKENVYFSFEFPKKNQGMIYPFDEDNCKFFKITKEFFRCKGNPLNPERIDESNKDDIKVYLDCVGSSKHGLPLIHSKEGVYPVLIDILNYIQRKMNKKVVITCGHRCPKHNAYADIYNTSKTSKHMIGAQVDFYVQGLEQNPERVVDVIFDFYKKNAKYKGNEEFEKFKRYENFDISTSPWFNKEIFIKLYQFNEGRDFDNRHPYPYISIQVLWDRTTNEKVNYTWEKAHKGYLHW
jgi:hypothetical protein